MPTLTHAARVTLMLFLVVAAHTLDADAQQQQQRRSSDGRIEVATTSGNYPIIIDGQASGETSPTVRLIDLPPGRHIVEIQFPNNTRWVRPFDIAANKRYCINLNFRAKTVELPRLILSPCPFPVSISAPTSVAEGNIITYSADVGYKGPSALNYVWTISPSTARLVSGAGTPTITVDSTGVGRNRVNALLSVDDGSGDPNCRQRAQSSTGVLPTPPPPVQPRRFDEFPSIAFDDDKARLDNFAIELQNSPGATGYVIAYGGRTSRPGQAARLGARAQAYLVQTRHLDASRIVVINGGYRDTDAYELWLVPQGALPPQPTPTVQPGDVRRRRGAR